MSASRRFEKLHRLENAKYIAKTFFVIVLPFFLVVFFITQNVPTKLISTKTATVTYVNSTTTNAETSAGGHPVSHVTVEFARGNKTQISVFSSPVPKVGDKVFVKTYKNRISGISYLYGGLKN